MEQMKNILGLLAAEAQEQAAWAVDIPAWHPTNMAPGTLVTGQRGTSNIEQTQRRIDMAQKILLLEPDAAPLTVITKNIDKRKTGNPKFQWFEDELDPRFDAVNNGAGYASGATSIVVDNGAYFEVQQLVYVPRTGEMMRVTAISTNTLTVVRGVGSTAAALVDNDELLIANTAQPEGDASRVARSRNPTPVFNYTQIFRTPWDATETERHSEFEADDDWDYQAMKHGIEHKKDIEYALMIGRPSEDTSSGQARRTTGGFAHFVSSNVTDAGGTFTEAELFTALRPSFRFGAKEKWGFASQLSVDVMNGFPRGKLEIQQGEKTFGLRVMQYISPHGTLNLVTHYLLEGSTLGGQIWIMDTDVVTYRYLQNKRGGRDTALHTEIQANDVDGRKDEYLTECGLQFGLEKRHGKVIGITG
jgi:hypothetical protein